VLQAWDEFAINGSADAIWVDNAHRCVKLVPFVIILSVFFMLLAVCQSLLQVQSEAWIANIMTDTSLQVLPTVSLLSAGWLVLCAPLVWLPVASPRSLSHDMAVLPNERLCA
jgi:hypothetical protein